MKANTAIKTMVIALIVMIGMTGFAAATSTSVTLDNKDSAWALTPGDGIGAVITYDSSGDEFVWSASGNALPSTEYSLIYYADKPDRFNNWGGDNPGAMIGTITTDGTGVITSGSGSINLDMDLPCPPDANIDIYDYTVSDGYVHAHGAKLWMVPSYLLSGYPGPGAWISGWSWSTACQPYILFETDLITYTDCDMYDTSPPPTATFTIGDAFNYGSAPIGIVGATNVGTVDLTLSYDASLVTVTGVTNGAMDTMYSNIGSGQVRILTHQSGNTGLNGAFNLVDVTFAPAGDGTCPFTISVTTFKDATPCTRTMPYDTITGDYCTYTNGDVNGDGAVDAGDVMYLAKHVVGITGFEDITCASDVDGTPGIDVNDVAYLAKHIIGIPGYDTLN